MLLKLKNHFARNYLSHPKAVDQEFGGFFSSFEHDFELGARENDCLLAMYGQIQKLLKDIRKQNITRPRQNKAFSF